MNKADVKCRICLSIMIKPVILPCSHEFCLDCFEKHLTLTSQYCPLCRRRVGTWARLAKKNNKLVSEIRWHSIKKHFPDKVKKQLNSTNMSSDTEADSDIESVTTNTLKEVQTKEKEITDKLKGFCANPFSVQRVSSSDKPGCSGVSKSIMSAPENVKSTTKRCASAESVDSISPELNHFRPIKSEPKTPPRQTFQEPTILKPNFKIARPRNLQNELSLDESCSRPFAAPLACLLPRWLQMTSDDNHERNIEKKLIGVNVGEENKPKPLPLKKRKRRVSEVNEDSVNQNHLPITEKRSICRKRQQEMEDYKLALKIQKNINRGFYNVDRSCSGGSPYFLRRRNPQRS